jgi:isopenicillin N synthase-like dioxygenase
MTQTQTIPVVDLRHFTDGSADERAAFVEALGQSLEEYGFVAVEGHGIPRDLIYENYSNFQRFFEMPDPIKKKYEDPDNGRQRGYTSFGVEHAKDNAKADLKEFFHLGRELDKDHPFHDRIVGNLWPEEMPALKTKGLDLFDSMDTCASALLSAISMYLGLPEDYFPTMAKDGSNIIRVIRYPVCDGFDEPGLMRAAQHEDINLMTILPEATESGLELLTRDGEWLPIHAIEGQIIVDTGDMMARVTNGKLPATTHRVVNPSGPPTPRYSMPFFIHPHPDADLEVLKDCYEGDEPPFPTINADEFLMQRLKDIGLSKKA